MRLKSFYAPSVDTAILQARKELGEDAMLIASKKSPAEAKHLGAYEIVFAAPAVIARRPAERPPLAQLGRGDRVAEPVGGALTVRPSSEPRTTAVEAPARAALIRVEEQGPQPSGLARERKFSDEFLSRGLAIVRQQLREVADQLDSSPDPGRLNGASRAVIERTQLIIHLRAKGLSSDAADSLLNVAERDTYSSPLDQAVSTLLASSLATHDLAAGLQRSGLMAFVGPSGSGKTSTLVKVAVRYGIGLGRRVHLLSADDTRIDGARQLKRYAKLIGAGFSETSRQLLPAQLAALEPGTLALVDTPGLSHSRSDEAIELAAMLTGSDVTTHLVAPGTMNAADLGRCVDRFRMFNPASLVFTRLDEVGGSGSLWSESWRTGIPMSVFSTGPEIPADLEQVSVPDLARRIMDDYEPIETRVPARMAATA